MATCRAIICEALRALGALGQGDAPTADELTTGLEAIQSLVLELHEARGPLLDVDAPAGAAAAWIPSENQRIRVQAGAVVTITLPNSIPVRAGAGDDAYGFTGGTPTPMGSAGPADGVVYRQPRDGARIEIVGARQALYLYRADINSWMEAGVLTLDGEAPINSRLTSALAALVAERLMETLPQAAQPTAGLARRIARGRAALMLRTGTARDILPIDYF